MNNVDSIIQVPEKLKAILDQNEKLSVQVREIAIPFSDILKTNDLPFFKEYTDHGIKHIENTLQYAENLIADETFQYLTPEEVSVMLLSIVLHDIGMYTNAEMFKNMIDGKYDNLVDLFPNGQTWKELWKDFLYDSQYWGIEKKNNVFGNPDYNIQTPDLTDLQKLNEYDKKLIGEFIRIHHCRIAHEVSINGYIGRNTIPFKCNGLDSDYIKISGIVARSHGMDVRDTFDYLEGLSGDRYTPFDIHAVYLMVLLRLADYLQIDSSRTNENVWSIKYMYSPYSQLEHKTHESIKNVKFTNLDKEKIAIQAHPEDAQTYVKIERLAEDIQKEFDRSWAILGEVYNDYNYKLRYRRITTNISNEKYKSKLDYVPEQFGFRYNNDLFKLLIASLYGDDPSYGVRELVQNAVDACRMCIGDLSSDGEPHVRVEVDSNKKQFIITDRGKGMNLYEIKNYFLTIGSSYNENIDWKKTRDHEHLFRAGRFGIGILAAFLLGSEITVVTKKRGENTGYCFTASLHDKFIQIDKAPKAEFGTTIEIKCNETSMEKLSKNRSWYNWYIDKIPKVEYYFDGEYLSPKDGLKGYRKLKYSSEKYSAIYWKPKKIMKYPYVNVQVQKRFNPSLYCNGFLISRTSRKRDFLLLGADELQYICIPDLQIIDIYNQLPLNLNRNQIDRNVMYEFEPELAREVFVDIMCQLMATNINSLFQHQIIDYINFHSEGFSLQSNYLNNYVKEKIIVSVDGDLERIEKQTNKCIETCKNLQETKYVIRFNHHAYGHYYAYERLDDQICIYYDYEQDDQTLYDNGLIDKIQFLFDDKAKIKFFEMKKMESPIPKTFIDDLFEKYMCKNPIIPYEFEDRKKKFPLLFQDYSDIIEQYMK